MEIRPQKTTADYLAIALCPLLIMVLVGSLAFFLLEISYEGRWEGRLRWALFWFVLASVLISRISITEGQGYAGVYGLLLAGATIALLHRLVGVVVPVWIVLGVIWWATSKLTWDCTLIQDDEDATNEGLLQSAGLEPAPDADPTRKRKWRKKAPGRWIIYFSLAALPLFGIGQVFLPRDLASRQYGFGLLWLYVAAGLGLLMATSFLSFRRYLRQRRVPMPATVSVTWIFLGTTAAISILLLCLFLPRPGATPQLALLKEQVEEVAKKASKYAGLPGQAAEGEGREIGHDQAKSGERGEQGKGPEPGDRSSGENGEPGKAGKGQTQSSGNEGQPSASGESPPPQPKTAAEWERIFKWIFLVVIALAALWFLARHGRQVIAGLKQALKNWRQFWSGLFARKSVTRGAATGTSAAPAQPFAAFRNPFASGQNREVSAEELVVYTFEALEAWARERQVARRPGQTPIEFGNAIGEEYPALAASVEPITAIYTRLAYAEQRPPEECRAILQDLWREMMAPPRPAAAPSVSAG